MAFDHQLRNLQIKIEPLERFIHLLANKVDDPRLHRTEALAGFRYRAPDVRHFCLLKAVRTVSAFNAAIALCDLGFTQEICVPLRTIVECTSHIDYVIAESPLTEEAEKFVSEFLSDKERGATAAFKRPPVRQGEIHASVGASLDSFVREHHAEKYKEVTTSKLYSAVYLNLSNYVHCRYPETMDLYGGWPGKFHLRGMRGTPKDAENISILETYFVSVSQCLQPVAMRLNLAEDVLKDSIMAAWLQSRP